MFEGNLTEISSDVIRKALCETMEKQLKTNKYKLSVSSASKAGENNFIGIIYRVVFSTDNVENGKSSKLQLILKVAPQNTVRREQFLARPAFMREIYTYETVRKSIFSLIVIFLFIYIFLVFSDFAHFVPVRAIKGC